MISTLKPRDSLHPKWDVISTMMHCKLGLTYMKLHCVQTLHDHNFSHEGLTLDKFVPAKNGLLKPDDHTGPPYLSLVGVRHCVNYRDLEFQVVNPWRSNCETLLTILASFFGTDNQNELAELQAHMKMFGSPNSNTMRQVLLSSLSENEIQFAKSQFQQEVNRYYREREFAWLNSQSFTFEAVTPRTLGKLLSYGDANPVAVLAFVKEYKWLSEARFSVWTPLDLVKVASGLYLLHWYFRTTEHQEEESIRGKLMKISLTEESLGEDAPADEAQGRAISKLINFFENGKEDISSRSIGLLLASIDDLCHEKGTGHLKQVHNLIHHIFFQNVHPQKPKLKNIMRVFFQSPQPKDTLGTLVHLTREQAWGIDIEVLNEQLQRVKEALD
ncbi:hypothetical protein BX600DRAFT_469784 [Xylariales sp. PMI_506]|nr:hypothetical protein BX600DRAFT_469784 [Xylariales sp. PMI_506]